jgi:hypothetical protein
VIEGGVTNRQFKELEVLLWITLLSENQEWLFIAISSEANFLYCPQPL